MSATENFLSKTAKVDNKAVQPFPKSKKIYVQGSTADIQVPMREISLDDTHTDLGGEKNPPLAVYDTSGPYTDPAVKIDIRKGLPALREKWIVARGDTQELEGFTSSYTQEQKSDPELAHLRFDLQRKPRKAVAGKNVSQMHYARQGIVTP